MAGFDEEQPGLRRQSTAVVLTPGHQFCHRGCVNRCCLLLGAFVMLIITGSLLYLLLPPLGAALLAIGPSIIIICFFYQRYACSVTKAQTFFTFCEAISWMCVLLVVIVPIDGWNDRTNFQPQTIHCSWEVEKGGKVFVNVLSYVSSCNVTRERFKEWEMHGNWDGLNCSEHNLLELGENSSELQVPRRRGHGHGSFSANFLPSLDEAATDATNGTPCEDLADSAGDVIGEVKISELSLGNERISGAGHAELAKAFDQFFARRAAGGCKCKKTFLNGTLPAFDYHCETDGQCEVADDCHRTAGATDECVAEEEYVGNVTAVFTFHQKTIVHAFISAYFRAGFLEELLKYVAVRRILFKDRVADGGALIVYGLAAAAGFATAENIQYTVMHGVVVTYLRMVLSIPLHCCTGVIIGIHLGYRKFLGTGHNCVDKFLVSMGMPVLIHGSYDFVLMLPWDLGVDKGWSALGSMLILVLSYVYCRFAWLRMDNVCVVHVKDLQTAGRVSKPKCCCCEGGCVSMFAQEDPLLQQRQDRPYAPIVQSSATEIEAESDNNENNESNRFKQMVRSATLEMLPDVPKCQTVKTTCPGCQECVRKHVLFPSDCPYCAYMFPDPVAM